MHVHIWMHMASQVYLIYMQFNPLDLQCLIRSRAREIGIYVYFPCKCLCSVQMFAWRVHIDCNERSPAKNSCHFELYSLTRANIDSLDGSESELYMFIAYHRTRMGLPPHVHAPQCYLTKQISWHSTAPSMTQKSNIAHDRSNDMSDPYI